MNGVNETNKTNNMIANETNKSNEMISINGVETRKQSLFSRI